MLPGSEDLSKMKDERLEIMIWKNNIIISLHGLYDLARDAETQTEEYYKNADCLIIYMFAYYLFILLLWVDSCPPPKYIEIC
jgi:hypothetical protein